MQTTRLRLFSGHLQADSWFDPIVSRRKSHNHSITKGVGVPSQPRRLIWGPRVSSNDKTKGMLRATVLKRWRSWSIPSVCLQSIGRSIVFEREARYALSCHRWLPRRTANLRNTTAAGSYNWLKGNKAQVRSRELLRLTCTIPSSNVWHSTHLGTSGSLFPCLNDKRMRSTFKVRIEEHIDDDSQANPSPQGWRARCPDLVLMRLQSGNTMFTGVYIPGQDPVIRWYSWHAHNAYSGNA